LTFTYRIDEKAITVVDEATGHKVEKKRPIFIVQMDGQDAPDADIRTPYISQKVSKIAKVPEFRHIIVQCQRLFASQLPVQTPSDIASDTSFVGGVVMDGRDIGSVVLKDAQIKIFLVADPKIRAERRLEEILRTTPDKSVIDQEAIFADLLKRDHEDENRQASPLIQAPGAIQLDSSQMGIDARVNFILDLVLKQWPSAMHRLNAS
jgi:CMP/dCMP kinase